jgi:hypothetical protein
MPTPKPRSSGVVANGCTLQAVAVLETQWGEEGDASPWFSINPENHTGGRLYDLLGHGSLLVTNACKELVSGPDKHGEPDAKWLEGNLRQLHTLYRFPLLLVCGSVARSVFVRDWLPAEVKVVHMPHPAWRAWTSELWDTAIATVRYGTGDAVIEIPKTERAKRSKQKREYKGVLFDASSEV